ncbi:hypothetical protein C8R47DRAFT_1071340 [Mycena vitilis]|nr:hypothetical protein C8R47DRAFT_1071340 [Mycena vitilis]
MDARLHIHASAGVRAHLAVPAKTVEGPLFLGVVPEMDGDCLAVSEALDLLVGLFAGANYALDACRTRDVEPTGGVLAVLHAVDAGLGVVRHCASGTVGECTVGCRRVDAGGLLVSRKREARGGVVADEVVGAGAELGCLAHLVSGDGARRRLRLRLRLRLERRLRLRLGRRLRLRLGRRLGESGLGERRRGNIEVAVLDRDQLNKFGYRREFDRSIPLVLPLYAHMLLWRRSRSASRGSVPASEALSFFTPTFFMLPTAPPKLPESLKTRYFIIYGTSDPLHGPGLERFWQVSEAPHPSLRFLDTPAPAAGIPVYERQRALLAFGYAFAALRGVADFPMAPAPLPLLATLRVEALGVPSKLPPPPFGLNESLKTRFFVIHGTSNPQHGPGLERFWLGPELQVPSGIKTLTSLVYTPGGAMPVQQRQRALSVFGHAFACIKAASRALSEFDLPPEPLGLKRHWNGKHRLAASLESSAERRIRTSAFSTAPDDID